MISFSEAAIASLTIISGVFIGALIYYLIEERNERQRVINEQKSFL